MHPESLSRGSVKSRRRIPGSAHAGWIAVRLGLGVLTLFVVSIVIFACTLVLPGDAARVVLGSAATPDTLAAVRAELGLDQSPVARYVDWVTGLASGDLGTSLISHQPVAEQVVPHLQNSLVLVALVALIGFPLAISIGILAAVRPGGVFDGFVGVVTIVISAVPEFVIALLLIAVLATGPLAILPAVSIVPGGESPLDHPQTLVLPVITLVLMILPYLSRQVRASLLAELNSEYVVMAELKGLRRRVVLLRHAMRNGLQPAVQVCALGLAYLLGGTVITEFVFQYPGIGLVLIEAVERRDITTVQAVVLLLAVGYVLINLVADILTVLVTPKLRTR